jgi:hypothetical protein
MVRNMHLSLLRAFEELRPHGTRFDRSFLAIVAAANGPA